MKYFLFFLYIYIFYKILQILSIMIGEQIQQKEQIRIVKKNQWACRPLQQRYTLSREIGQGAYGSVYEGHRIQTNRKIALKKMQNFQQRQDKEGKQGKALGFPITTLRQIKLLQHLEHENILNIIDVVYQRPPRYTHKSPIIYLCLDLMDSDLGYLVKDSQYKFSLFRIQKITEQILLGLAYLHSKNIAHRDLKPANILINSFGLVRVADFGLAKKLTKFSTTNVVTMWYRAPELFFGLKTYSTNIDIWSLGCIIAQFMINKPLFGHCLTQKSQLEQIYEYVGTPDSCEWHQIQKLEKYELFKPQVSKQSQIIYKLKKSAPQFQEESLLLDLIQKMLRLNPNSRYSATECLEHDFFKVTYEREDLLPQFIIEKKAKTDQGHDFLSKRVKY